MTTILVADDVTENRYFLSALLKGHGYEVVPAVDGAEALRLARASPPALVVTDLMMPVMDGFELCRHWKQDERLRQVPLVVYTATYTDPKDERLALSLGADRFLVKPQTPEVLLAAVREVLAATAHDPGAVRAAPPESGVEQLRQHNEALQRKLEKKVRELEAEIARSGRIESALREKERKYRLIAENSSDVVWSMDLEGRFTYVSPSVFRVLGYTPAEVIGWPPREALGPEALALIESELARVKADLRAGSPPVHAWMLELQHRRKDGSMVWTEVSAGVMRDEGGEVTGVLGVTRDITERKMSEQLLKESEHRLRFAGRMARLGGWSVALDDRRVRWSDEVASIHGKPPGYQPTVDEALGFYSPDWQPRLRAAFEACAREGIPFDEEMELVTAQGRRAWVRTSGEAVRDAAGAVVEVQGAFQDVTDRKQAEEERQRLQAQLLQSQKLESVGRLAGGIAHDFNNLMSVVLTYTEFAVGALREGDPLRADLLQVQKAGERAATLTKKLLAFSRKQLLEPQVLGLNKVVTSIESLLRRLLGEDVQVVVHLAEALGRVKADPGQLEQVLMNLAVNARDAMPRGGTLTIETSNAELDEAFAERHVGTRPGPYVRLAVTDTGTGMDAETRDRIFEPFFTTKDPGKGTGLGLSIVYGIVKQSGGGVRVDSAPGRGTTFEVFLPRVDAPETAPRHTPLPAVTGGTERVLLVEDEEAVRKMAERILRGAGYQVLAAAGAGEALLLSERHGAAIDLLVTDQLMPQMNGRELSARLLKQHPGLRVLYMSGYPGETFEDAGMLGPRAGFLGKPFVAAELTRKVREVLDEG